MSAPDPGARNQLQGGLWCTDVLALLPELVAQTLDEQRMIAAQAHVARCGACAAFGETYQAALAQLRTAAAAANPDGGQPDDDAPRLARSVRAALAALKDEPA